MSSQPSNPPLLLTKRLTSFLQSSRSPALPTLLLTSPAGKLLAHASPEPVARLRTYATVAGSLFSIHTFASRDVGSALPGEPEEEEPEGYDDDEDGHDDDDDQEARNRAQQQDGQDGGNAPRRRRARTTRPEMITVQLSAGVVVLRRLACGLLFVCVGPALGDGTLAQDQATTTTTRQTLSSHQTDDLAAELVHATLSSSQDPQPASSSSSSPVSPTTVQQQQQQQQQHPASSSPLAPGDSTPASAPGVATTGTEAAGFAAVAAIRRQATELAAWLDDKLGGLRVPEEGVGVDL